MAVGKSDDEVWVLDREASCVHPAVESRSAAVARQLYLDSRHGAGTYPRRVIGDDEWISDFPAVERW
jgi:hypothetical protein